jgi:hypothetical protein
MADQTFKSPGFFDREIDLSSRAVEPSGTPAAIIGASLKGPAFVPVTLGSFSDFQSKFGDVNPKLVAPYAVQKWLDNRFSCTFMRVLGAGANTTQTHMDDTRTTGRVANAGFKISGSAAITSVDNRYKGAVQFLVAKHAVTGTEVYGFPMFTDNNSFFQNGVATDTYLVRGMLFSAYDTRIMVMSASDTFANSLDDFAAIDRGATSPTYRKFKLVISSSAGSTFATTDGYAGLRILTASLNPSDTDYVGKVLNTDPDKFETEKHLLYCDFAVDNELASVVSVSGSLVDFVAVLSGSSATSSTSGDTALTLRDAFGRFDTRYKTPRTPWLISQPFGATEHNLFYVEALDDGTFANSKIKVSVANLLASTNPANQYGTFSLIVRDFADTDVEPRIIEQFNNLTLDPDSDNYVAKVVGDTKVSFMFDVMNPDDRRLIKSGNNPNKSKYIRVVMSDQVERKTTPVLALPFGFRGFEFLNTNSTLTDRYPGASSLRLGGSGSATTDTSMFGAIIPPLPYRFKVTRGEVSTTGTYEGSPGPNEITDTRFYWGVKTERNTNVLNPNVSNEPNPLVSALTKFQGLPLLDVLVTGSYADTFSNNKFTLAKVALSNTSLSDVTASAEVHMKEAAYIRNGTVDPTSYTVTDGALSRVTLATLLMKGATASVFNRFSDYAKFTTVLYGGFDGVNILDKNASRMNDKATSTESGGGANSSFTSPGFSTNQSGTGKSNNAVFSYQTAVKILTDPLLSQHNLLVIPGIREPFVTDYAGTQTKAHALSMYIMDIPYYDFNGTRIFDGDTGRFIDVSVTADNFEARVIDNNYVAAYFPNIVMDDTTNNRKVVVPASVGALGALGYNDRVAFPWFAPAGFNRAALNFVNMTQVRINQPERDRLTEVKINPIVKFPREGHVIMAQNTLQQAKSSLSSINVKRMILEVKRVIVEIGNRAIFDQITTQTRNELVKQFTAVLGGVQTKAGMEMFSVICDDTNNTSQDIESNRMNVQIRIVPTRAVEYIAINFVVTNSGVQFV